MQLDRYRKAYSLFLIVWFCGYRYSCLAADFVCETDYDCEPNGSCNVQRLTCDCHDGWYGVRCDRDCKINCQNGSKCIEEDLHGLDFENEWSCQCKDGYSGGLCQIKDSALVDSPSATTGTPSKQISSQQTAVVPFVATMAVLVLLLALGVGIYHVRGRKTQQSRPVGDTTDPIDIEELELPKVT